MFDLVIESEDGGGRIIAMKGEIDIYSAPDFKDSLYSAIGEGKEDVVLDCSELSYIDSMGLGILVGALKRLRQHGRGMVVRNPRTNVRKLFKITGLDKVFILEEVKV